MKGRPGVGRSTIGGSSNTRRDLLLGAIVALIALVSAAASGFARLDSWGDADRLMRLVEVRDLIDGQGWFDLHYYRLGPEGGIVTQWSRIVDAPIAAIILAASELTGSRAIGEDVAAIAWPLILMVLALALMLRIARALGGDEAVVPMLFIGGLGLALGVTFQIGNIDHHNVQVVLLFTTLAALATGRGLRAGLVAGAASGLMLAIGMEALPYAAVAGLVAVVGFVLGGDDEASKAFGFGVALAACGAAAFVGTVPASAWTVPQCDAYSVTQLTIAMVAGAGLAIVSGSSALRSTPARRLVGVAALGAVLAATVVLFFPQCVGDPFEALPPLLELYWLSTVGEAKSLGRVLAQDPALALVVYVTPLIALVVYGLRLRTTGFRPGEATVAAFLATALAVSMWQVRGMHFSAPLASVILALWVTDVRTRAKESPGIGSTVRLIGVWLVSLNLVWVVFAGVARNLFDSGESIAEASASETCQTEADYARLAALPPTTVLALFDLGPPILAETPHRVLAGPHHRNVEGNLAAARAFTGSPRRAHEIARKYDVGLVAICRGDPQGFAGAAPSGFLARLVRGRVPRWLEIVPGTQAGPVQIYRVR
jgi:hypothetical protein